MKRISRLSTIAIIAVIACVLLAGIGYAYWTVQKTIGGNSLGSGSMKMDVLNVDQSVASPLVVTGLMPGAGCDYDKPAVWQIKIGSAPTGGDDLAVSIQNIESTTSLKDNVMIAVRLLTGEPGDYWLKADGSIVPYVSGDDTHFIDFAAPVSAYEGVTFNTNGVIGMTALPSGAVRHLDVYYYLPTNCAPDCHDDAATFDIVVEALQHH